jgi:chemotaxis protein methyltransferase CheR
MSGTVEGGDVRRFRAIVGRRLGLQFDDGKLDYLGDVLRERMEVLGCTRFNDYEARLTEPSTQEVRALADRITVAETYFFRYWDHFRAFAEVVLPDRAKSRNGRRQIRVLSAGCASGEEAYSLAILIREHLPAPESWKVDLLGIDVSPGIIEKARRARYSAWSLRDTSAERRARYFCPEGRELRLDEAVARMASFEERNLVDDDPLFWHPDAYDVVFCRNVLMYFSPEVMAAVVARITRALSPGGFLFLGHAETLRGVSQDFHLRHTHETFYYQRRDAEAVARFDRAGARLGPRPPPMEPLATALDLNDCTWVGAIQRASERVAQLARAPQPSRAGTGRDTLSVATASATSDLRPALELLRQERFGEAMDLLHALPISSKNDPDAQLLRAALLTNSGKLREAEEVCAQILALDELSAGAHYLMALCREHAGDRGAALDHDQAAMYLDAGFAMPHLHLGLLARRSGDRDQARAELERALTLLAREDAARILLFGGGFSREALVALCRSELRSSGGGS